MSENKSFLIEEERYQETMATVVEPALAALCREEWTEREAGRPLYCAFYEREAPLGTVLISHGFTETARKYTEVIYDFLENGFQVVIPEHCGHGRSYRLIEGDLSLVHVDSWQRYVDDLLFVAGLVKERYGDLPLYLYAHSMGGGIAAAAAAKEPWLFTRMVLSSPMIEPSTGDIPLAAARTMAATMCMMGKGKSYVMGQHGFEPGQERFADSAATSEPRFEWYRIQREAEPLFQTCAASYGWIHEAIGLSVWLRHHGCKQLVTPTLLFQAHEDAFVSTKAQTEFIRAVNRRGQQPARLIHVPGTKHEIYNADNGVLEQYWKRVFAFLRGA